MGADRSIVALLEEHFYKLMETHWRILNRAGHFPVLSFIVTKLCSGHDNLL